MAEKKNQPGVTPQETAEAAPAEQSVQLPDASAGAATDKAAQTTDKPKKTAEPKVSDAVVKIGKSLLKAYPELSVVYMTSDGRGFYQKDDAEGHARTLKNQAVTPVEKQ